MVRAMRVKLAPVIGIRRQKDEQANEEIRIQNQAVLVGFRSAYVFEKLSHDLWPRLYALDGTCEPTLRAHPRWQQLLHRSIVLPCSTIVGYWELGIVQTDATRT
jgi:hypothetical protein